MAENTIEMKVANEQHALPGLAKAPATQAAAELLPDARWFADAGLRLFRHWDFTSVRAGIDLSWGMVAITPWCAHANGVGN